jgi:hypothetical protein
VTNRAMTAANAKVQSGLKPAIILILFISLFFVCSALGQDGTDSDDSAGEFTGTLNFDTPIKMQGNTEYEFTFKVTNTTIIGASVRWIYAVELLMPSAGYTINADAISTPDSLHIDGWSFDFNKEEYLHGWGHGRQSILWLNLGLTRSFFGDIREGEVMDFAFIALTDENATDGFDWTLTASDCESCAFASSGFDYSITGTAYVCDEIGCGNDADRLGDDADDTEEDGKSTGDDDDNASSGCGC